MDLKYQGRLNRGSRKGDSVQPSGEGVHPATSTAFTPNRQYWINWARFCSS